MSAVSTREESPRLVSAITEPAEAKAAGFQLPWRRIGIYAVLAIGFFMLGATPMWLRARHNAAEREVVQHELRLAQLENRLMAAAIDARRGDYEPARQAASDFFTSLRNQIAQGGNSDLSEIQRVGLENVLAQRDDIITLLARNDPAAADRLSSLHAAYSRTMSDVPPPASGVESS